MHVYFDVVWDKNCVKFIYLSGKIVCWDKQTKNLPNIPMSLDFVIKSPLSNKPPLECLKLNIYLLQGIYGYIYTFAG